MDQKNNRDPDGLAPGLYEQLVDAALREQLARLDSASAKRSALDKVEQITPASALAQYLRDQIRAAMSGKDLAQQLQIANHVLHALGSKTADVGAMQELENDILLAVHGGAFDKVPDALLTRPSTSLASNAVFTATLRDPQLFSELRTEIRSADLIYLVVSFILWSGVDLLYNALQEFAERGGELRVLSTTYMGNTEIDAIERLANLPGARVRMSLDTDNTRLHAKAYVFCRNSGFSTAYVGSSNISKPALTSGFEWNTKIAAMESPEVFKKILVTCDEYWNDRQFVEYDPTHHDEIAEALRKAKTYKPNTPQLLPYGACVPFSFQAEVLDKLQAERLLHNRWRNLVVAATGTGKTMMAAFDYQRYRREHPESPCRLLFVAHREEILQQSIETFRRVLGDRHFGELHVGKHKAAHDDHLFISIQSANASDLCGRLDSEHFDYIVVDEFHHAAAPSYKTLMEHFSPKILLGLTATPERLDEKDILHFFGGRIAAEIRLPAAIDQDLLCPFHYYGLADTVDLDQVKWKRGGYDVKELSNLYTMEGHVARRRAQHILDSLREHTASLDDVKALGFCVSVEHAEFMADYFSEQGVDCAAISGKTATRERHQALRDLADGRLKIIFCVDLFNEGVDIPQVNTVLLLRPTESLTIFLQQLGRGLRLHEDKDFLLVLDFIGQANRRYDFQSKFEALLRPDHERMRREIKNGFRSLPRACSIELEKKPMEIVLESISRGFNNRATLQKAMEDYIADHNGEAPSLAQFLDYCHLSARDLYRYCMFSRLLKDAGKLDAQEIPLQDEMTKGLRRLAGTNAPRFMQFIVGILPRLGTVDLENLSDEEQRMVAMFYLTIWGKNISGMDDETLRTRLAEIAASPVLVQETTELMAYLIDRNDRMVWGVDLDYPCPLEVHGTYTRDQIYASLGNFRPQGQQGGVLRVPARNTEALFVTLDKSATHFNESISYEDYAIDEHTFHWQSPNTAGPDTPSGKVYLDQRANGTHILLFVRRKKEDEYGAEPYRFIGPASFIESTGSKPMSIKWRLKYAMDPSFFQTASRLVV